MLTTPVQRKPVKAECDRHSSALAYTAWYAPKTRAVLTLCAHCARQHDVALTEQGFELAIDDRDSLTAEPPKR